MNFSKKEVEQQKRSQNFLMKKKKTKRTLSMIQITLVICFVLFGISMVAIIGALKQMIQQTPDITSLDLTPKEFATIVYDENGTPMDRLVGANANRIYVPLKKIPKNVQNAFIAIEDERFWIHNGIDIKGIFRALFHGIQSGKLNEGASTLTQQLLKNEIFKGGNEKSFFARFKRKLQEQYLAIQVEKKWSKEKILEAYLNTINLGQGTLGVEAASLRYFHKSITAVNLSEAAVLASITKNPLSFNPITHPNANAARHILVLQRMYQQGYITKEDYVLAKSSPVYEQIQLNNQSVPKQTVYSYFTDETIRQVLNDLQVKKGYSQAEASSLIYRGGLRIYTTQDAKIQKLCDTIPTQKKYLPAHSKWELNYQLLAKQNGKIYTYSATDLKTYFVKQKKNFSLLFSQKKEAMPYIEQFRSMLKQKGMLIQKEDISFTIQPQLSFVLLDQTTGQVKAILGGRGKKPGNRTLNRACETKRQPGSTFKILSTYLPALDTAGMTLATTQDDTAYTYPDGTPVKNWYSLHKGFLTLRDAITCSSNVIAVKTLAAITPQVGYDYLKKLGFTTLVEHRVNADGTSSSDIQLPLALGGLTDGVTNLELTAAFAAIANHGLYHQPIFYTKVLDRNGTILLQNESRSEQVMKESSAWLLTNAMQDVVKTGTAKSVQFTTSSIPIAGKTGTTTGNRDLWFCGFTPYYTATIWSGYDQNESQTDLTYHKRIWKAILEQLHAKKPKKDFVKPASIVSAKICTKSGKLPLADVCELARDGGKIRTEYFAKGTVPTETCNVHVKLSICMKSHQLASEFCPSDLIEDMVFLVKKEIGNTADTPFLLPKGIEHHICSIHQALQVPNANQTHPASDLSEKAESYE